jgi:hypothetical protein
MGAMPRSCGRLPACGQTGEAIRRRLTSALFNNARCIVSEVGCSDPKRQGQAARRCTRWRLLPAGFLMGFGGLLMFLATTAAVVSVWSMLFSQPESRRLARVRLPGLVLNGTGAMGLATALAGHGGRRGGRLWARRIGHVDRRRRSKISGTIRRGPVFTPSTYPTTRAATARQRGPSA